MRDIRWSYRIRGKVPRTQIKANARKRVFKAVKISAIGPNPMDVVKSLAEKILIAKILVYSAIKISAKGPLLYSVLKPDTSSDSPSAMSKGVRLVSANIVINQMRKTGATINKTQEYE